MRGILLLKGKRLYSGVWTLYSGAGDVIPFNSCSPLSESVHMIFNSPNFAIIVWSQY